MKTLVILNDPPYGSERTYNGLRLAGSLARKGAQLRVFLIGEADLAEGCPPQHHGRADGLDPRSRQGPGVLTMGAPTVATR